jgi:site-specific DNA recombinase
MARVMVAVGNKSSRDTSRRVAAARERDAAAGKYGGGRRPFGYQADGVTLREPEAAEVRAWADALLSQGSLYEIAGSLRKRKVPTVTGAPWDIKTVRAILLRPRNAGYAIYRGAVAREQAWPAILDEATWRGVCALLADPARRTSPGNQPKWLGSQLYRCGACGDGTPVTIACGQHGTSGPRYACRARHLSRSAIPTDELVAQTVIARLARPDAAGLLAPPAPAGTDTAALHRQASALRERKTELARLFAAGAIDAAQLEAGSKQLGGELDAIGRELDAAASRDPLAGLAGQDDAAQVWAGLPLGRRRAIVRLLCEVTLLPGRSGGGRLPGGGYFNPDLVRIEWRGAAA